MKEDNNNILPLIKNNNILNLINLILFLFTNQNKFIKRFSLLILLLFNLLLLVNLGTSHHSVTTTGQLLPPLSTTQLTTTTTTSTKEQDLNYNRLKKLIHSTKSNYNSIQFKQPLHSHSTKVTAIILNWKRLKGLHLIISHLSKFPFIREIIIYNNNQQVDLRLEDFELYSFPGTSPLPSTKLRIYNSPANVHDAGKHLACSLATYDHCYFNDDDWLNVYLDSLYTKYLDCCSGTRIDSKSSKKGEYEIVGGKIASNTLPIIHLEHRRWRFQNSDVNLHTGFTWLGTGSFSPKHFSVRFMEQQSMAPILLTKDQSLVADMFFSLWTNTYPEQMPNNLVPIDIEGGEVGWSLRADVDQWSIVYTNILDAVRKLYDILLVKEPYLVPFPFTTSLSSSSSSSSESEKEKEREVESTLRAPCANDECLFDTSLTPFKNPSTLIDWSGSSTKRGGKGKKKKKKKKKSSSWSLFGNKKSKPPAGGEGEEGGEGFNPWEIDHIKEYESIWNEQENSHSDGAETSWPSDEWWIEKGSWHLAVDGKGLDTCWESWRAPVKNDHFGLLLVKPRLVQKITLTGSKDLETMLGFEKSSTTATDEEEGGWEVHTMGLEGVWITRRLRSSPLIIPLSSSSSSSSNPKSSQVKVSIELIPIVFNREEELGEKISIEEELEGNKIRRIKFVWIGAALAGGASGGGGKKSGSGGGGGGGGGGGKLEVCEIDLDGWSL